MTESAKNGGLIGRDTEVEIVRGWVDAGGAGVIVGEAGIGKSAVIAAALGGTTAAAVTGGGISMLSSVPLLPLSRAVHRDLQRVSRAGLVDAVVEAVGERVLVVDDIH